MNKVLKIKPDVLKSLRFYARQRKPKVLEHFAQSSKRKFGVDEKFLEKIEATEQELDLELVKEFARFYKFPLTCFLLPKPLKDDLVPPDYRKVPSSERGMVSPKGALALRAANRAQYVMTLLNASTSIDLPQVNLNSNEEKVVLRARVLLSDAVAVQKKSNNPYEFFVSLRSNLERLGILVLKLSFPVEDARAFSLTNEKPYVIVVNNKDGTENGYTPKLFSLLHEFGHILLRSGGLCNDFSSESEHKPEGFCNAFAASFLVPKEEVETLIKAASFAALANKKRIEFVDSIRKTFLASGEVIIRRIYSLGHLTWDEKESLINDWNSFAIRYRKEGFMPRLSEAQKCVGRNGKLYTSAVFEGIARGAVTPENATAYLGIKLKHFQDLKKVVSRT